MASLSDNLKLILLALGEEGYGSYTNYGDVENANWEMVEAALTGKSDITITASNVTLSDEQQVSLWLNLTGTLTGNRDLVLKSGQKGFWLVKNGTTGAYDVTIKPSGGSGFALPQGHWTIVVSDGSSAISVVTSYSEATDSEAIEYIASQTVSGGSAIAFTTGFSTDYDEYIFEFVGVYAANDNDTFYAQISVDEGSNWLNTGYYSSTGFFDTTSVDPDPSSSDSTTRWNIITNADNTALGAVYGRMKLYLNTTLAVASGQVQSLDNTSAHTRNTIFGGRKVTVSRANAIRFVMAIGNETGTVRMYGVRHS